MGIQDDIMEDFFKKLEYDVDFPRSIVDELRILWENGEISSQEEICKVIERGKDSGIKNQND